MEVNPFRRSTTNHPTLPNSTSLSEASACASIQTFQTAVQSFLQEMHEIQTLSEKQRSISDEKRQAFFKICEKYRLQLRALANERDAFLKNQETVMLAMNAALSKIESLKADISCKQDAIADVSRLVGDLCDFKRAKLLELEELDAKRMDIESLRKELTDTKHLLSAQEERYTSENYHLRRQYEEAQGSLKQISEKYEESKNSIMELNDLLESCKSTSNDIKIELDTKVGLYEERLAEQHATFSKDLDIKRQKIESQAAEIMKCNDILKTASTAFVDSGAVSSNLENFVSETQQRFTEEKVKNETITIGYTKEIETLQAEVLALTSNAKKSHFSDAERCALLESKSAVEKQLDASLAKIKALEEATDLKAAVAKEKKLLEEKYQEILQLQKLEAAKDKKALEKQLEQFKSHLEETERKMLDIKAAEQEVVVVDLDTSTKVPTPVLNFTPEASASIAKNSPTTPLTKKKAEASKLYKSLEMLNKKVSCFSSEPKKRQRDSLHVTINDPKASKTRNSTGGKGSRPSAEGSDDIWSVIDSPIPGRRIKK